MNWLVKCIASFPGSSGNLTPSLAKPSKGKIIPASNIHLQPGEIGRFSLALKKTGNLIILVHRKKQLKSREYPLSKIYDSISFFVILGIYYTFTITFY